MVRFGKRNFLFALMLIILLGGVGVVAADDSGEYQLIKSWETFDAPWGITVDINGNVYVSHTDQGCIEKFTSDGKYIRKWGSTGSCFGEFASPKGVAVDYIGDVYIADSGNHRIQKFDVIGTALKEKKTGNCYTQVVLPLMNPEMSTSLIPEMTESRDSQSAGILNKNWGQPAGETGNSINH